MDDFATVGLKVDSTDVRKASGDLDKFAKSGDQAGRSAGRATGAIDGMARGAIRMAAGLGLAVSAAAALTSAFRGTQQYTVMTNSLRAIGMSGIDAASALEQIGDIAARTRAPLEATAQLYQRISIAGRDLGASSSDVLRFTENVGLALAQVGGGGAAASGALLQLSQAMSGGIVRAEEFNSILEGAFPIAQAAANAIEGAAGSVGQLRNMVIAGEISSREFFEAILSQSDALEDAFANTIPTISGAMQVFRDQMTLSLGSLDSMVGGSESFAQAILLMAENLDVVGATLGVAVTAFGVKYVAAMGASVIATFSLTGALALLKTALVTTGIGALIVGAGYLVAMFGRLVGAAGGFGNAMTLLGDVASGVWQGIVDSGAAIPPALNGVWELMRGGFLKALSGMATSFHDFVWTIGNGMAGIAGMEGVSESLMGLASTASDVSGSLFRAGHAAEQSASGSFAAAGKTIASAFGPAREAVAALNVTVTESAAAAEGAAAAAIAMNKTLEDIGGGGGGTGAGGGIANDTEAPLNRLQSMLGPDDPTEAIEEWYETAMTALEEAHLIERGMLEEHNDYKLEIERLYQSQLSKIQADEHSARLAELGGFFGAMATIAETGGAKMAKIAATFSGAQAMMAAYEAAMKAAAEAKTIPGRLAAYAMFVAKGVQTVAAIKRAGDSPSSAGGGAGGGQGASGAQPAPPPQTQNVTIDLVGATGRQIDQFQAFADTFNEASRQGLMTNVTVRGA
jgi:tape measure domain-containing protein